MGRINPAGLLAQFTDNLDIAGSSQVAQLLHGIGEIRVVLQLNSDDNGLLLCGFHLLINLLKCKVSTSCHGDAAYVVC
ncbi:hypothetical protein D3C73_1208720 [compost metagenome]